MRSSLLERLKVHRLLTVAELLGPVSILLGISISVRAIRLLTVLDPQLGLKLLTVAAPLGICMLPRVCMLRVVSKLLLSVSMLLRVTVLRVVDKALLTVDQALLSVGILRRGKLLLGLLDLLGLLRLQVLSQGLLVLLGYVRLLLRLLLLEFLSLSRVLATLLTSLSVI